MEGLKAKQCKYNAFFFFAFHPQTWYHLLSSVPHEHARRRANMQLQASELGGVGTGCLPAGGLHSLLRAGCLSSEKEINFQQKIKARNTKQKTVGKTKL